MDEVRDVTFPDEVYVTRFKDNETEGLEIDTDINDVDFSENRTRFVAVYELKEVVKVERQLLVTPLEQAKKEERG